MTVVEIITCVAGVVSILNYAASHISRLRRNYHIRRKNTDDGQPQPRYFILVVDDDQNIKLLTL